VAEFTRAESITLLRNLAPSLTEDDANRVATAIEDLPVAVGQAGALLADTGLDVQVYLRLVDERAEDVFAQEAEIGYPQSVAASWAVAFDRLSVDDSTALDLLTLVAWCGPEPFPLSMLAEHAESLPAQLRGVTDPLVMARCIAILRRRGLVTVSPHALPASSGTRVAVAAPHP
jgi:hypothetical protein